MSGDTNISIRELIIEAFDQHENPRKFIIEKLQLNPDKVLGENASDSACWRFLITLATEIKQGNFGPRTYITQLNDVLKLVSDSKKIIVIIGAGASCGPDFRSPGGLYDQIAKEKVLSDPYQVFDLDYFCKDPTIFWRFAHLIFPERIPQHSDTHRFLAGLSSQHRLLRLYSQNVDTLELDIPDEQLRCVHGSWRENACSSCGAHYSLEQIRPYVEKQEVPHCTSCGGLIKPGIVFFGQPITIEDEDIEKDASQADLLIVIGTSLRVAPVSYLPRLMRGIPAILINNEPVTCDFDAELIGTCSDGSNLLSHVLGIESGPLPDINKIEFVPPNKFVMPSNNMPKFDEDGRSTFIVTESNEIIDFNSI